ncbi:uncharacterized protein LOC123470196 isoform X1 [Daphnia magna]|uniref:uncharacterized protein LOC123470196 isoform X1 n=1 Tax=Daphnia magna TaxID=35525 RepID=UPI001E1BBC93|nr:uncharacterized protein LOC123470196 isoform X1 [Daphnia magna]
MERELTESRKEILKKKRREREGFKHGMVIGKKLKPALGLQEKHLMENTSLHKESSKSGDFIDDRDIIFPVTVPDICHLTDFDESLLHNTIADVQQEIFCTMDKMKKNNKEKLEVKKSESQWLRNVKMVEQAWHTKRGLIHNHVLSSLSFCGGYCSDCEKFEEKVIRCESCRRNLCSSCDLITHRRMVFHTRVISDGISRSFLLPHQFLNDNREIMEKNVPVPCFLPEICLNCGAFNTLVNKIGCKNVAVITTEGRFDLTSAAFGCKGCTLIFEARAEDYIASGFWPASPEDDSYYLFCRDFLRQWFHLQHKSPSISRAAYIGAALEASDEHCRVSIINETHFVLASAEYEYHRFRTETDIQRVDYMACKACGDLPLASHCDGNMKCYRYATAGDHGGKPLFEGVAFATDEEVAAFTAEINQHIPQLKGNGMCGVSTFQAAKLDSACHYNGLDETGMISTVCRHGSTIKVANMYKGETYRLVAFLHMVVLQMGCYFFCYDVVCKYWPFAQKLSKLAKEGVFSSKLNCVLRNLTKKMRPFLSTFHGKAHQWACQVLWSGHLRDHAAATLGEEQEQTFAKMSRYCSSTKRMSKAHRIDHLTKAILYENARKENNMVVTLIKRLKTATQKIPNLERQLQDILTARDLKEDDLPEIKKVLEGHAKTALANKGQKSNWPVENLQRELEGISATMNNIKKREMRFADGCKKRNPLRKKLASLKVRSAELLTILNEKNNLNLTEQCVLDGIFPWETPQYTCVSEDLKLVNTWMLIKRCKEEVSQTKHEMCTFIQIILKTKSALEHDIGQLRQEGTKQSMGKIILKNAKLEKLTFILTEASFGFDVHIQSGELEDFIDLTNYEDGYQLDEESEGDVSEYDENENEQVDYDEFL